MADMSPRKHVSNAAASAKWLVVMLLACVAAMLLVELGRTSQAAAGGLTAATAEGKGLHVTAAQISPDSYGVYLVDADKGTMCLYQYVPAARKLRLLASRNFTHDMRLEDYNTQPPPSEIKELVDQQGKLSDRAEQPTPTSAPAEEQP